MTLFWSLLAVAGLSWLLVRIRRERRDLAKPRPQPRTWNDIDKIAAMWGIERRRGENDLQLFARVRDRHKVRARA